MIYLDNNATTRVDPEVVAAMAPFWSEAYFNPTSIAGEIIGTNKPILEAKTALASLLRATPEEFVITSGATEANNWVLQSTVRKNLRTSGECHLIVSAIEHPSVLETAIALKENNKGVSLDLVPVDNNGVILIDALAGLVSNKTSIVSIMLANNETGVIQPISEAAKCVKEINPNCYFHTDATQAVGKIMVNLEIDLCEVDFLSLSAHKLHGPKGIGSLFIRSGRKLDPLLFGGGQQNNMRSGTENPALAAGLAKALKLFAGNAQIEENGTHMRELRDLMESTIINQNPFVTILGSKAPRLPNTSLLIYRDNEGEMMVHKLLENNIIASTGSACSQGSDHPSHVVTAMGVDFAAARNVLRLSMTYTTKKQSILQCLSILSQL